MPRRLVFYQRSAAHRGRRLLSLAFAFDREEDVYQFAAAAPYSYSRLQRHLAAWEKKAQGYSQVSREAIAQTTQKRRVDLITIGDVHVKEREVKDEGVPAKGKGGEGKRRVVLILARVHGGEPPASFICQGNHQTFVIPMLNPDGVFLGNQRADLLGADLNRSWHRATSYAHPALVAVGDLLNKLRRGPAGGDLNRSWHRATTYAHPALVAVGDLLNKLNAEKLDFIIDIHADLSHEGVFVRGNSYDDVYRFERHAVLPKFLAGRIEAWQPDTCMYNADPAALGSARRSLPTGNVDAYSLLASLGGRRLSAKGPFIHYTEDACRALAKALCDYYRHVGVIPPREGLSKKKKEGRGRRRRRRPVPERERSPSSSRERRVVRTRVVTPPLPPASPPPPRAPPPLRHVPHQARPRTVDYHPVLPVITGTVCTAVRTPRLAVVDLSAYIRTPAVGSKRRLESRMKLARPPRPSHPRYTSDEYDTHESDS
ncbi:hypothetical protein JYU34_002294 [Plutella xylostella]|uniref:Peptidase M14 domain-containing protein n=1 Tax=Plutella xylostella TaxID=51655 RepID=A0ABQ7R1T9_PLUXY|nr:hypothetical protein JYU34_002294 [Plutella xylostella]